MEHVFFNGWDSLLRTMVVGVLAMHDIIQLLIRAGAFRSLDPFG